MDRADFAASLQACIGSGWRAGFSKIAFRFRRKRVPILVILVQICGCERFFVTLKGFSERFENRHASDLLFCRALLHSEKSIVHNRKFVPKRERNGHVHDRVHRIIPRCGRRRHYGRCRHHGRRCHYGRRRHYFGRRRYRRNVVVAEAASGALRNRRRKRPPWLLCLESKVLCASGTALSLAVAVARALIGTRPLTEACLPTNAFMSRRTCRPPARA